MIPAEWWGAIASEPGREFAELKVGGVVVKSGEFRKASDLIPVLFSLGKMSLSELCEIHFWFFADSFPFTGITFRGRAEVAGGGHPSTYWP